MWAMTEVRPRGKQSSLSDDSSQAKEWLDNIPDLGETYKCKSYDELSKIINDWLNEDDDDDDTGESLSEAKDVSTSQSYSSIDEAFADLIDEE
jgi:hypothetical protein